MNFPSPLDPPTTPVRPLRRRLHVSLRGLMVLVLVFGGGIGWKVNKVRTQQLAIEAIRAAGGTVLYDYQFSTDPERLKVVRTINEPSAPRWLRRWVGDDFFQTAAFVLLNEPLRPELLTSVARLDDLIQLRYYNQSAPSGNWAAIGRLTRLEVIELLGPGIGDSALAAMSDIPSLRSIRLIAASVTDSGIAFLSKLPALRSLTVRGCPAPTDAAMGRMLASTLSPLEEFTWERFPGPVPSTVRALAEHHRNLRQLELFGGPLKDADLAPIGVLTDLKRLYLTETGVTDAGLVSIEPLLHLQSLTVNLQGVTDLGMKSMSKLRDLRYLDLSGSQVSDLGLAELIGLSQLTELDINRTGVTDASAETLGRMLSLETLQLINAKMTDAALIPLQKLKKLRYLWLGVGWENSSFTAQGAASLRTALPQLAVDMPPPP